ncbi:MAG: hypothetical protein IK079_00085 [Desulfovibrio sp.]|nr:hypothetical protein [Desulfovibrio sp.]
MAQLEDLLNEYSVDDALLGKAYDTVHPKIHAAIKTAIAVTHAMRGIVSPTQTKTLYPHLNLQCTQSCAPISTIVVLITQTSQAKLLQAALLPRLADVPHVYAYFLEEPTLSSLLTLELAGIDVILTGSTQPLAHFYEAFPSDTQTIVLGTCSSVKNPLFQDATKTKIAVTDPKSFDVELIKDLQQPSFVAPEEADLIFSTQPQEYGDNKLVLSPGLEAFWQTKTFRPKCFLKETTSLFLSEKKI